MTGLSWLDSNDQDFFCFPQIVLYWCRQSAAEMSVEKMMNRLRSFSQAKKELREENKSIPTVPSKEDIISTIDGFGNRIEGKQYFPRGGGAK